jgi:hypothetical protein
MMLRHDAHCHTHMAVVLGKRVNGQVGWMVFRCNESNETLYGTPRFQRRCCVQDLD